MGEDPHTVRQNSYLLHKAFQGKDGGLPQAPAGDTAGGASPFFSSLRSKERSAWLTSLLCVAVSLPSACRGPPSLLHQLWALGVDGMEPCVSPLILRSWNKWKERKPGMGEDGERPAPSGQRVGRGDQGPGDLTP